MQGVVVAALLAGLRVVARLRERLRAGSARSACWRVLAARRARPVVVGACHRERFVPVVPARLSRPCAPGADRQHSRHQRRRRTRRGGFTLRHGRNNAVCRLMLRLNDKHVVALPKTDANSGLADVEAVANHVRARQQQSEDRRRLGDAQARARARPPQGRARGAEPGRRAAARVAPAAPEGVVARACRLRCRPRCRRTDATVDSGVGVTIRRWIRASTSACTCSAAQSSRAACATPAAAWRSSDRARACAQRRQRSSVPLRQLLPLPDRLRRARRVAGARRRRPQRVVLPAARRGARDLGRLRLGPDAAPAALGVDQAWPLASARREVAGAAGAPERGVGAVRRAQRARIARSRPGSPRCAHARATASRRRATQRNLCVPLDEMRLTKDSDRAADDAARRAHLGRRARARDALLRGTPAPSDPDSRCASTKSRPSCCTSFAATARSRPPIRASSPPARTPACCTTPPATPCCVPASCA